MKLYRYIAILLSCAYGLSSYAMPFLPSAQALPVFVENEQTFVYSWGKLSVVNDEDGNPQISAFISRESVIITATVQGGNDWTDVSLTVQEIKKEKKIDKVVLHPVLIQEGRMYYRLYFPKTGEYIDYHETSVDQNIPFAQTIVNLNLENETANDFVEQIMQGAILEIVYSYKFKASIDPKKDAKDNIITQEAFIQLNGYCSKIPENFRCKLDADNIQKGCIAGMTVTDVEPGLDYEEVKNLLPEMFDESGYVNSPFESQMNAKQETSLTVNIADKKEEDDSWFFVRWYNYWLGN